MKYFILAGEKSGDLHGSNLIQEIKKLDNEALIQAWGGDSMENQGAQILIHHNQLAIMGILGVIQNIQRLKGLFKTFGEQIEAFQPDAIIFIDYGGFNLKAAKIAKKKGFQTHFYIAPKVWAWNKGRVEELKKWIDHLYVIFPFELKLFSDAGIPTTYVGNPLQDAIQAFVPNELFSLKGQKYIALLAGSRKQEIKTALPLFEQLAKANPDLSFVIAGISDWKELYQTKIPVLFDQTYDVVQQAELAIVTSGTATLETALLNTPQIVVYKTDWVFYSLAKIVIQIKYISLVNIILDKLAVPELIQAKFSVDHMTAWMRDLLTKGATYSQQKEDYKKLQFLVGNAGASKKTAELIYSAASAK
ncbi:lipid-A-disaccharide synthase [Aquirufa antheringensis]|jgi:lipid-A-disaccharide synthase|uniref:Lipid-A-disaccharide synthase n=1 Tax=Aquirufa antheringensis TaxID=2516559 RepID=A0A4Q9BBF3_9BACT|nr:lipid-A-disaccharide synthase [Aquirufa antheringensis]MCL9968475.1 lipid-A-disaccharide synthase [Aquirufa antheringensis]MCZ2486253.1 lipid-A-disaccharide synthase [Aquirufa antheringensis]MCZ2488966.1 lipid-A-disaccharide synthase [Aquirufa antheringensis]TBH69967.1 lipid-A-disaccharide synthase [Aquirufa antheringensis]TBH73167.1 lipid-A-disaccharide synthase [Aquirufa antheringensis]